MGKVSYATGIDYVSGSLAKPKKGVEGHKCGTYLIGTHRVAPTENPNCTRLYVRKADAYERSTAPSADELALRQRFAAISRAVATRSQDLTKMPTDKAAFLAQKDLAGGKKTMKSYLWSLEKDLYDQNH